MELLSREGGRHCFILSLEVTKKKEDQKNLRSKLVDDCPKLSNEETNKTNRNPQIMTFWTRSSEHMFPKRSARWLTEQTKIPSNNKNDVWWAVNQDVVKTFFSMIYTTSWWLYFFISITKLVRNVFWTGSEYQIMRNFIVLISKTLVIG